MDAFVLSDTLIQNIRLYLIRYQMIEEDLEMEIDVPLGTISRWEDKVNAGIIFEPTPQTIYKIAEVFHCEIHQLYDERMKYMLDVENIQDQIDFLQRYIIVHSYLYYNMSKSIITDRTYDMKQKEIVALKNAYPEEWEDSQYYYVFGDDYNGASGFGLFDDLTEEDKDRIRKVTRAVLNTYIK